MKTLFNKIIPALLCSVLIIWACSDLNDINREYLDRGEYKYVGRVDSVVVNGGENRVLITAWMHYAKTAERCVINWMNGTVKDSITVPASNWQQDGYMRVIIDNLEEGSYNFYIHTFDSKGNRSIYTESNGVAYGDFYISSMVPKILNEMKALLEGMNLSFGQSEKAVSLEIEYENTNGSVTTLHLAGNSSQHLLPDWELGGLIRYRTGILPEINAIDTLYSEWSESRFPLVAILPLDKSKIEYLNLPFENPPAYGSSFNGVFDGITAFNGGYACFYMTADNTGIPMHVTFDLGVHANLLRFELWGRDNYTGWNPEIIQVWGKEGITSGSTPDLSSMDENWETEALDKGWKKLTENTCIEENFNTLTIENPEKVRYVIIRVTKVKTDPPNDVGPTSCGAIGEITFYSDDISPL